MFQGVVPKECIAQILRVMDVGNASAVYNCCSGTFRFEQITLAAHPAVAVHSNDVSLYSSAIAARPSVCTTRGLSPSSPAASSRLLIGGARWRSTMRRELKHSGQSAHLRRLPDLHTVVLVPPTAPMPITPLAIWSPWRVKVGKASRPEQTGHSRVNR